MFLPLQSDNQETISSPELWLAASADRRVSVWSADWSKDFCELIDWLTFPAPAFTPDGTAIRHGDNVSTVYVIPDVVARQRRYCATEQTKTIRRPLLHCWRVRSVQLNTRICEVFFLWHVLTKHALQTCLFCQEYGVNN